MLPEQGHVQAVPQVWRHAVLPGEMVLMLWLSITGPIQIDSARMSGLNEVLAVYLMAAKLDIPVCPHAGGVGLCNMVPHLQVCSPEIS